MAKAVAFSPKEWTVAVQGETTAGNDIHDGMFQLDVDSISMPSLNVTQVVDVRNSGTGRTFKSADFFQDNVMRVSEISLSGRFHNDSGANGGHHHLIRNITDSTAVDSTLATGYSPTALVYGTTSSTANHFKTFSLALIGPSASNAKHMLFEGCVVTNFALSADAGTDGGAYKWSATIQSGRKPELANSEALSSGTAYVNTNLLKLSNATATKVANADVALQSFTVTIDNPAVFSGVSTTGYQVVNRGAECAVTLDCQVKYDANTDEFINLYDIQGTTPTILGTDAFNIAYAGGGVDIDDAVWTNVGLSEGDIMMLDCSLKAVDDGSTALVTFDFSA